VFCLYIAINLISGEYATFPQDIFNNAPHCRQVCSLCWSLILPTAQHRLAVEQLLVYASLLKKFLLQCNSTTLRTVSETNPVS
jgi:hypothetical protein